MLSADSPFLNIPAQLDRKQAVFLDGIRHAVQISGLSYVRLCKSLTSIARIRNCDDFSHVFLDAWAFIDAVDRFRFLWQEQPSYSILAKHCQEKSSLSELQDIRNVRNVSAHIAQKIDQIVSLNSSVLGAISWVTLLSENPLNISTHFIRPGIMFDSMKGQFAMPNGEINFIQGSGSVSVTAGKYVADLSNAYATMCFLVGLAEKALCASFQEFPLQQLLPKDMLGCAELDTSGFP